MRHLGILITFLLLCVKIYSAQSNDLVVKDNDVKPFSEHLFLTTSISLIENTAYLERLISENNFVESELNINYPNENVISTDSDYSEDIENTEMSSNDYPVQNNLWYFIYLYVALIGFYLSAIILFNKKIDRVAKILISSFIFIHSAFILHIYFFLTNYVYEFPHTLYFTTSFSFLYGPLLYFYFKRTTQQYRFKKVDLLHLIPTILIFLVLLPIYILPAREKLSLLLDRSVNGSLTDTIIIVLKLLSLIVYGYFIRNVYLKSKKRKGFSKQNRVWQKNVYTMHIAYVICYAAYGFLLANGFTSGILIHLQIGFMASMVMYLGYSANVQPDVFSGTLTIGDRLFYKYEKSGLTESLSNELKQNLITLFDKEGIYKENDINLETLASRLNTTRHNASQVINEHFDMNFHELINKYRINEAKQIFNQDYQRNLNIIDVAYEVGYNNKVTFNKAFKKDTKLTPSEYQRMMIRS